MYVELERGIFFNHGVLSKYAWDWEGRAKKFIMTTPNEELHAKFFNEEAVLVQTMTDIDLDEHIHELETIAREAKARILAASEEKRTRKAKAGSKAWRIEPSGPDPNVTDSLNKVKQRSARMSKLDKMRDKMAALGLSDADIDSMVSKMVSQARKEPEALRAEAEMKKNLNAPPALPVIPTEEERQALKDQKEAFKAQDKADAEKERLEKQQSTEQVPAETQTPSVNMSEASQPIVSKPALPDWLSKLT